MDLEEKEKFRSWSILSFLTEISTTNRRLNHNSSDGGEYCLYALQLRRNPDQFDYLCLVKAGKRRIDRVKGETQKFKNSDRKSSEYWYIKEWLSKKVKKLECKSKEHVANVSNMLI
jgi:hypothetical protein